MQRDPEVPPQVGQDCQDEVRAQRQPSPDGRVHAGPDGGEEEDEDLDRGGDIGGLCISLPGENR
jgi:hypothetical protein